MINKIWRFTSGLLIFSILAQFVVFSPQPVKAAADIAIFGAHLINQYTVRVTANSYAGYSLVTCDVNSLSKIHLKISSSAEGNPVTYFTPTNCVSNPDDQLQVLLTFSDPETNVTGFASTDTWTIFFDEGAIYDLNAPTTVSAAVLEGSAKTVFDFASPDAISYSIASNNFSSSTLARVGGGDTITVTFEATEELRSNSIVVQIAGINADSIVNSMGNIWTASRQVGSSGPETNGLAYFSIQIDDSYFLDNSVFVASSVTAGTDGSFMVIDAPPVVTGESITGPNEITITYSEPVTTSIGDYTDLNLTAGGSRTVTSISGNGTQTILLTFSGAPAPADETGTIDISGSVEDIDDVPDALVVLNDSTLVDGQNPSFTSIHISSNNASTTLAKPLDTVTITLTANEPITVDAAAYTVNDLAASSFSLDGQTITITRVLDFSDPAGFVGFSLSNIYNPSYTQAASTVTSTTDGSRVYLDNSAPMLSIMNFTAPNQVTITFTEPLSSAVTTAAILLVSADGVDHAVTAVSQTSGSEYVFTFDGVAVGANSTGSVTFDDAFTMTDLAGNTSSGPIGSSGAGDLQFPIISPITFTSSNASSTLAKVGDVVTLGFTAPGIYGDPTVTIAGNSVTPVNTSGSDWTATYTLTADDTAGAISFLITVGDDYANSTSASVTTGGQGVTFDKTAPSAPVITTTAQTTSNSSITITGTAEASAAMTISGGSSIASGTATGGNYSVVVNLTTDSVNTLFVTASDASGNISTTSTVAITHQTATTPPTNSGGGGGGGMPISSIPVSPVFVPSLPVTENVRVFAINTPVSLSVGGTAHTVTVLMADNRQLKFVIQSEPKTVTIKFGEVSLIDTDNDGVADVRAEYKGLENGQPKLSLSNLTDTNETQKIFTINSGAYQTTDSSVMIKLNQTNAVSWAVSNSPDFKDVIFETYRGPKKWSLAPSLGAKTVYVKVLLSGGMTVSASDTITLVATAASTELPVIEVPPTAPTVVSAITFVNEKNKIVAPGKSMAYTYRYKNTATKVTNVTLVRELVDTQNEVVETAKLKLKLRSGETFNRNVSQLVSKKLLSGTYTVKITVLDSRGVQIDTNKFTFTVVTPKQKVFSISSGETTNNLIFDQTLLAKYNVSKVLSTSVNLGYRYTNTSEVEQNLKAVRQLISAQGKIISSTLGTWVLKPGESFDRKFTQNLPINLPVGEYSIRVAAYDKITKALVVENKLLLTISEK